MPPADSPRLIDALVVDDEPWARRNLTILLRRDRAIGQIGECSSGRMALEEIRRTRPDLVFLDVRMPECNGFDVLEMLGTEVPAAVIFVTAHDAYALRAFDAGALDYLLKPFVEERFRIALARAKEKIARAVADQSSLCERFVVRHAGRVDFVPLQDIDWIEAADYYVQLHVSQATHLLRRSLAELERELEPRGFCRIHRSIIVNLRRVRGLELRPDGEYDVVLESAVHLRVSRNFRKALQARLTGNTVL